MKPISIIGLVTTVLLSACGDPPPPELSAPLESRVELAAGEVWLVADGKKDRLITGMMLPEDSRISVGEGGRALVRLSSGAGIFLRAGTEVVLSGGSFRVIEGEIWADVPDDDGELGRFDAGEVSVTASGAGFDLGIEGGRVSVYVARGLAVLAAPGGRVEIQSGERGSAEGKGAPVVEAVAFWEDWTGGMADRRLVAGAGGDGRGRIYGIDPARPGAEPQELQIMSQRVGVIIRDGIARTTVDQRFFNPTGDPLEGWYWFTVPEDASVERFAIEVDGALVEGEMIERKQAAAAYEEAVRQAFDPALLEWVDGRSFRARIYPVPAVGERRVVLSYTQILPMVDRTQRYVYPMGSGDETRIQEFSLEVDLGDEGKEMEISALQDALIDEDGSLVTMRRSGYAPRSDFLLEMRREEKPDPMRICRYSSGGEEADYVLMRYSPEVEWDGVEKVAGDVVVVLDTSAGGDDSERQIRSDFVEAVLRALSGGDRFAVVAADLVPRVIYPKDGLSPAGEKEVAAALEGLAEISSAGATDLGQMFNKALELVHESVQPAVIYIGDGRATVGETTNDELAERLRRSMGDSRARLFTVAVGDDANHSLLERLAKVGGGRMFRVESPEETVQEAIRLAGLVKTPTITDLRVDAGAGLDQVFTAAEGKVSEGEEIILLARTHHALPDEITVHGRLAGKDFERKYESDVEEGSDQAYIARLWARMYLQRLMGEGIEESRGAIISLGITYALMTPLTSFLVLERDEGQRHRGEEGQRGKRDEAPGDKAYAIRGPVDNPDPGMAMPAAKEAASSTGILGALGDGESFGYGGLGLQGTGRGGGGEGDGSIGLGNLNTIGHSGSGGTGSGYGRGAGGLGGRSAQPPRVKAGAADVKGSLSKEVIRRIVHRHINEVKYCYERELAGQPGLEGLASVKFIISPTGTVQMAAISRSTIGNVAVENCLTRAVQRWTFPTPEGNGIVIVTYPFQFASGDGAQPEPEPEPEPVARPAPQPVMEVAAGNPYEAAVRSPFTKTVCSDASRRPLSHRRALWMRRLAAASGAPDLARIFYEAGARCELETWRDRAALLDLLEGRLRTPEDVSTLIGALGSHPTFAGYLRRRILRRSLDPELAAGIYFGSAVDWVAVRRGLAALKTDDARLAKVREALESRPDDPVGRGLLVEVLTAANETGEAMAVALRLRRDGMAGPSVMKILCDLQAETGLEEEARRSCSELVEFNPEDPVARRQLGDLFLRHRWYEAAYRQFNTLVSGDGNDGKDPVALLRLAAAAAGMGKTDEALRLERKVASGEGEPGPDDPRLWARLLTAARLCEMILGAKAANEAEKAQVLERELKRAGVTTERGTLHILVWEDLEAALRLTAKVGGADLQLSNRVSAPTVGMAMIDLGSSPPDGATLEVNVGGGVQRRGVGFTLYTILWDGKAFSIQAQKGEIPAGETEITL